MSTLRERSARGHEWPGAASSWQARFVVAVVCAVAGLAVVPPEAFAASAPPIANVEISLRATNESEGDDAQFFGSFSANGTSFTSNLRISAGTSNSHDSQNGIDYGDDTGLSYYGGLAHPAWADNSNSTGHNPDGALHALDIYTAAVP